MRDRHLHTWIDQKKNEKLTFKVDDWNSTVNVVGFWASGTIAPLWTTAKQKFNWKACVLIFERFSERCFERIGIWFDRISCNSSRCPRAKPGTLNHFFCASFQVNVANYVRLQVIKSLRTHLPVSCSSSCAPIFTLISIQTHLYNLWPVYNSHTQDNLFFDLAFFSLQPN